MARILEKALAKIPDERDQTMKESGHRPQDDPFRSPLCLISRRTL